MTLGGVPKSHLRDGGHGTGDGGEHQPVVMLMPDWACGAWAASWVAQISISLLFELETGSSDLSVG